LAGFFQCALETRWQQFGQFLNDVLNDFLYENFNFLDENLNENLNDFLNNKKSLTTKLEFLRRV